MLLNFGGEAYKEFCTVHARGVLGMVPQEK